MCAAVGDAVVVVVVVVVGRSDLYAAVVTTVE